MSYDFFKVPDKPKPKAEKQKKKKCPYCGKSYANLTSHLKRCLDNPDNVEKPKPKKKITTKTLEGVDEGKLIEDLRAQFQKTLNPNQKEDILLSVGDQEKLERVYQFLGGTEGYQFIFKTITGDKIRGSMPYIIDQCIEWLKKHRLYILHHKTKWPVSKKSVK